MSQVLADWIKVLQLLFLSDLPRINFMLKYDEILMQIIILHIL